MGKCCDEHRLCYHQCSTVKNNCDEIFEKCLMKSCHENQDSHSTKIKSNILSINLLSINLLSINIIY